jgi:hypothetical protein
MTSADLRSVIQGLRELNEKRTQGEITAVGVYGRMEVAILARNGKPLHDTPMEESLADLFAALANACDAGLLDAAERGLEAPYLLLKALNDTKAELAAVEAERDRLVSVGMKMASMLARVHGLDELTNLFRQHAITLVHEWKDARKNDSRPQPESECAR